MEKNNRHNLISDEMNTLKYCPFCGNEPNYFMLVRQWKVFCEDCGIRTQGFDTKKQAFKAWNKRKQ